MKRNGRSGLTRSVGPFLLALLVGACSDPTAVDLEHSAGLRPAILSLGNPDDPLITMPEAVVAGQEFEIEIRTWGGSGCHVPALTSIEYGDRRSPGEATIVPYNMRSRGRCLHEGPFLTHRVTVQFNAPGTATVRIRGIRLFLDSIDEIEVVRTVLVTPD